MQLRPALACLVILAACSDEREPVAAPVEEAATPATGASTSAPPSSGHDDLDAWCAAALDVREATLAMDAVDPTDPEAVEAALTEMVAVTEAAAELAPREIASDVTSVLELVRGLERVLAEADYDFLEADPAGIVGDSGADEANARIETFNAEECGLEPIEDAPTSVAPVDTEALRQQAIDVFVEQGFTVEEAACLFDNMDLDDPGLASDEDAMLELIQVCELDLERLAATMEGDG